jgi:hypothetical protein
VFIREENIGAWAKLDITCVLLPENLRAHLQLSV